MEQLQSIKSKQIIQLANWIWNKLIFKICWLAVAHQLVNLAIELFAPLLFPKLTLFIDDGGSKLIKFQLLIYPA